MNTPVLPNTYNIRLMACPNAAGGHLYHAVADPEPPQLSIHGIGYSFEAALKELEHALYKKQLQREGRTP